MQAYGRVGRPTALQVLTGEDKSPRSNPTSYPTHLMKFGFQKEKKIQSVGNREELHRGK